MVWQTRAAYLTWILFLLFYLIDRSFVGLIIAISLLIIVINSLNKAYSKGLKIAFIIFFTLFNIGWIVQNYILLAPFFGYIGYICGRNRK